MPEAPSPLRAKLQKLALQLPYMPRALGLAWSAAPRLMLAWLAMVLILGLLPAAVVWLTRPLVNGITAAIEAGGQWEAVLPVIILGAAMAAVILAGELLRAANNWIRTAQSERVGEYVSGLIHDQSMAVDLAFYDMPAYYDHLHRARYEAGHRPLALLESMGGLMRNSITLAAMAALILPYGWWLPPLLLASTLPALYVALRHTLRRHAWRIKTTADDRRTWYYDWLLTSRETAAELRLFNLGRRFRQAYQQLRRRLRIERLQLIKKESLAGLGASAAGLLTAAGAMAWMAWRTLQGHITLGDLALFYQAFNRGQGLMRSLLEDFAQIYGNSLFLGNLFQFLELKPQIKDPPNPKPLPKTTRGASIRFNDVHFSYPTGTRPILNGLNLDIPAGRIAAIVGPNGAGKSTLVKLLCRFYDPLRGDVFINGINLRTAPLSEVRAQVTALFQEPVHYSATVAENIALSENSAPNPQIQTATDAACANHLIRRLPNGYETLLGTWFEGGTELSVGERQRIALARAFYQPSPILVLDEPTSAMDPWAEAEWLRGLRESAAGRTVLLITHRLTTAMAADIIFVIDEGRVIESGTHAALISAFGPYQKSWHFQPLSTPS